MAAVFKKRTKLNNQQTNTEPKAIEPTKVIIDYPVERDMVKLGHYGIRIASDHGAHVQVSINNGDWFSCRAANGYFWFDWLPNKGGTYSIVARAQFGHGSWKVSDVRSCVVVVPKGKK